jgi:hypothetical protein
MKALWKSITGAVSGTAWKAAGLVTLVMAVVTAFAIQNARLSAAKADGAMALQGQLTALDAAVVTQATLDQHRENMAR